ncbi:MAG: hypothetical protein FJW94_09300 [Actinobacteria bacterium]|nr:hypothetical protein [Actinomycetota bacterium]
MTRRRWAVTACLVVTLAVGATACGDGTPDYCDDLREVRSLDALRGALDADDLPRAAAEANRLSEIANGAPEEIAPSLQALAGGVSAVVGLLEVQESNPAEYELQREQVQQQLGTLADDAAAVSQWTEEQCGFRLLDGT